MTTTTYSHLQLALRSVLIGLFLTPFFCFSQDYNGGFEVLHPSGAPIGWARSDVSATAVTTGAYAGEKAIRAWINDFYRVGIWTNYSPEAVARELPGATINKIPNNLSGFYLYDGSKSECETALVTVFAGKQEANGVYDTLAFAEHELWLNKEFEPFSFPVGGNSSQVPEFVEIKIEPRGKCYYRSSGKCCYLTMDELRFDQDIAKVEATIKEAKSPWVKTAVAPVRVNPDKVRRSKNRAARRKRRKQKAKLRKGKGRTGPFNRKKKTPPAAPASEPIPTEIQKEIDRINKYQQEDSSEEEKAPEEVIPGAEADVDMNETMESPAPETEPTEPPLPNQETTREETPAISDEVLEQYKMTESELEGEVEGEEFDDGVEPLREGFGGDDVSEEGSSEDDEYF